MIGHSSTAAEIIAHLRSMRSEENVASMARFGIVTDTALGIGNTAIRKLARLIGKDQPRAHELWRSGVREARLLAIWTFDPMLLAVDEAKRLAEDFNSWEIVDAAADLLTQPPYWHHLVEAFATDDREFVRRAAFAMIAGATVHNKKEPDETFLDWLPLIERNATDPRHFVKKRSTGHCAISANAAGPAIQRHSCWRKGWRAPMTRVPAGSARTRCAS